MGRNKKLNITDNICKNTLSELEKAMKQIQKQHFAIFNNPSFQSFLKEKNQFEKIIEKTVFCPQLLQTIEQQQKIVGLIGKSFQHINKPYEKFYIPSPIQKEESCIPILVREDEKPLTKKDIEKIAELFINKAIKAFEEEKEKTIKRSGETILYLSVDGDLYRKPKSKYSYPLHEAGNRIVIIKMLDSSYRKTKSLLEEVPYKNRESLSQAIKEINRKFKYHIKIKNNLIEGRQTSGYRINPKYKIIME